MKITVAHKKTKAEVIELLDKGVDGLFSGAVGSSIEIANYKKERTGSTLKFSFTSRMGFISLPIHGTIDVDDTNAVVEVELPSLVKNFIGEGKVAASVEKKVQLLLAKSNPPGDAPK